MKAKRKYRINKEKIIITAVSICLVLLAFCAYVNFLKYPEQYMTTWKYQLENDLSKGNQEALDYYNNRYVDNNKLLFGDKYIV